MYKILKLLFIVSILQAAGVPEFLYTYQFAEHEINSGINKLVIKGASGDQAAMSFSSLLDAVQKDVRPFVVDTQKSAQLSDGGVRLDFALEGEIHHRVVLKIAGSGKMASLEYECPILSACIKTLCCWQVYGSFAIFDLLLEGADGKVTANVSALGPFLRLQSKDHMLTVAYTVSEPLKKLQYDIAFNKSAQNFCVYVTMARKGQSADDRSIDDNGVIIVEAMYDLQKKDFFMDFIYNMHRERYVLAHPSGLKYIETRPMLERIKTQAFKSGQYFLDAAKEEGDPDALVFHSHNLKSPVAGLHTQICRLFLNNKGLYQLCSMIVRHEKEKKTFFLQLKNSYAGNLQIIFSGRVEGNALRETHWRVSKSDKKHYLQLGTSYLVLCSPSKVYQNERSALAVHINHFGDAHKSSAEIPLTPTNIEKLIKWDDGGSLKRVYPNAEGCLVLQMHASSDPLYTLKMVANDGVFQIIFRHRCASPFFRKYKVIELMNMWGIVQKYHYVLQGDAVLTYFFAGSMRLPYRPAEVRAVSKRSTLLVWNWLPDFFLECIIALDGQCSLTFNKKLFLKRERTKDYTCFFSYEEQRGIDIYFRSFEFVFADNPIAVVPDGQERFLASIIVNKSEDPMSMLFSVVKAEEGRCRMHWCYNNAHYEQAFSHLIKSVHLEAKAEPQYAFYMNIIDCQDDAYKIFISPNEDRSQLRFFNWNDEEIKPDHEMPANFFGRMKAPAFKKSVRKVTAPTAQSAVPCQNVLAQQQYHRCYYQPQPNPLSGGLYPQAVCLHQAYPPQFYPQGAVNVRQGACLQPFLAPQQFSLCHNTLVAPPMSAPFLPGVLQYGQPAHAVSGGACYSYWHAD